MKLNYPQSAKSTNNIYINKNGSIWRFIYKIFWENCCSFEFRVFSVFSIFFLMNINCNNHIIKI